MIQKFLFVAIFNTLHLQDYIFHFSDILRNYEDKIFVRFCVMGKISKRHWMRSLWTNTSCGYFIFIEIYCYVVKSELWWVHTILFVVSISQFHFVPIGGNEQVDDSQTLIVVDRLIEVWLIWAADKEIPGILNIHVQIFKFWMFRFSCLPGRLHVFDNTFF